MQTSSTTNDTPYHIVYGVVPPSNEGVLGKRVLDEEEMYKEEEVSVATISKATDAEQTDPPISCYGRSLCCYHIANSAPSNGRTHCYNI